MIQTLQKIAEEETIKRQFNGEIRVEESTEKPGCPIHIHIRQFCTETKYISYTIDGTEKTVVYDEKLAEMLKDKKIKHKTIDDPFSELEKKGIGTSWIKSYLETVAKK